MKLFEFELAVFFQFPPGLPLLPFRSFACSSSGSDITRVQNEKLNPLTFRRSHTLEMKILLQIEKNDESSGASVCEVQRRCLCKDSVTVEHNFTPSNSDQKIKESKKCDFSLIRLSLLAVGKKKKNVKIVSVSTNRTQ